MKTEALVEEARPTRAVRPNTGADRRRTQKRRKRKNKRLYFLVLLAFILVALIVLAVYLGNRDDKAVTIKGKWSMDKVTVYEFKDSGHGALILPSAQYDFTYEISKNTLKIFFEYEGAKNAQYTFELEADKLVLIGGNETTQGTYTLYRIP